MLPMKQICQMQRWQKNQMKKQVEIGIEVILAAKRNIQQVWQRKQKQNAEQLDERIQKILSMNITFRPLAQQLNENGARSQIIMKFLDMDLVKWAQEIKEYKLKINEIGNQNQQMNNNMMASQEIKLKSRPPLLPKPKMIKTINKETITNKYEDDIFYSDSQPN